MILHSIIFIWVNSVAEEQRESVHQLLSTTTETKSFKKVPESPAPEKD